MKTRSTASKHPRGSKISKKKTSPNIKNRDKEVEDPFTIEQFLTALNDASVRSRAIFLLLIFTSVLILMALVNSLKTDWNWYKSRMQVKKAALRYLHFPGDPADSLLIRENSYRILEPVPSLDAFIAQNERQYGNLSDSAIYLLTDKVAGKYGFAGPITPLNGVKFKNPELFKDPEKFDPAKRIEMYELMARSLRNISKSDVVDGHDLRQTIEELTEAQVENLQLVQVPILGISFEVNFLGFYGGLTLIGLYLLFYYSLVREHRNLKILFSRGWTNQEKHHYFFYEFVSMYQVLSVPRKLFEPMRGVEKILRQIPGFAFLFPTLVLMLVTLYDYLSFDTGRELNELLAYMTSGASITSCLIAIFLCKKIHERNGRIDRLWDNQAYEFNIEFIREALGEDKEINFPESLSSPLKGKGDYIRYLWRSMTTKFLKKNKKLLQHQGLKRFDAFVENNAAGQILTILPGYKLLRKRIGKFMERRAEKKAMRHLENFLNRCFQLKNPDFQFKGGTDSNKKLDKLYWKPFMDWFETDGRKNVSYRFRTSFRDMLKTLYDK